MSIYFFEIHFFGIIWRTSIWTNREINYEFKSIMDKGKNWMIDHVFAFHMKCDHPPQKNKVSGSSADSNGFSKRHCSLIKSSFWYIFKIFVRCGVSMLHKLLFIQSTTKKNFKWPYFLIYGTSCSTRGMCVFWKKISLSLSLTWITQSKS